MDSVFNVNASNSDFLIQNISACEYIDDTISTLYDMKNSSHVILQNTSSISFSFAIIAASIITILFGARLFRVVAAFVFALLSFFVVYEITNSNEGITCTSRIGIASVMALICAFITGCLIKFALFVIGAVTGAGIVHISFVSFPIITEKLNEYDIPEIMDKSVIYWALLLAAGLITGLWMRCNVPECIRNNNISSWRMCLFVWNVWFAKDVGHKHSSCNLHAHHSICMLTRNYISKKNSKKNML